MSCDAVRELYEQGLCEICGAVSLDWVRQAREFVAAMKPHVKFQASITVQSFGN